MSERNMAATKQQHALVIAYPRQGHINPLMQISKVLASHGFIITFAVRQQDFNRMMKAQKAQAEEEQQQHIRFVGIPEGQPIEYPTSLDPYQKGFREAYDTMLNMRGGVDVLIEQQYADGRPITSILSDSFMVWAHELASKFALPLAVFFTSNATACAIFWHAKSLKSQGIMPFTDENGNFVAQDMVSCILGVPPIHPRDFPACLTLAASHYRFQFMLSQHENFRKACAVVMNAYEELESTTIAALRKDLPIYPVGPLLLLLKDDQERPRVEANYWTVQDDCLKWLDKQPSSSVLYLAFGSLASLPIAQMHELAMGLEASRQRFLWVIRSDMVAGSVSDILPEGFLSRTKDRGHIVSWAPQLSVLAHPSVGGFVSHCGWNSTIENLSVGGLPVLGWPQLAEQRLNCRILVDQWKIAMEFKREEDGMVRREEVERVVRALMEGEEGRELSRGAMKLMEAVRAGAEEGGPSQRNMEALVQALLVSSS